MDLDMCRSDLTETMHDKEGWNLTADYTSLEATLSNQTNGKDHYLPMLPPTSYKQQLLVSGSSGTW